MKIFEYGLLGHAKQRGSVLLLSYTARIKEFVLVK